ncbi:MAG: methionine--tRNA ligase [Saprospiraceae bacterium]|nr:methionine--tRNA ligase [Saprospiraceae bacterium]
MTKKYTITAALPYANGALHLGHLAGVYVPADIYARFLRLEGKDVAFVCGSDEHGAAITIRAKKEGKSPKEIIDKYHSINKDTFEKLGISFDIYHRTSEQLHHETAQEFFLKLEKEGLEFEKKASKQYYDEEFNQFLADRYIIGTCPKCGHEEAYGDQCEKCGSDLSPTDLIDPRSTLSGKTPVLRETTHWYFKLNQHTDWLKSWLQKGKIDSQQVHDPIDWKKHVVGQCLSWLDGGLQPRAITRDLDWGIKVPVKEGEGKVLYVWFDAPIGYISATKQWAADNGKDWKEYWQGENTELVHFIGKDNIVFHCIIFPAMLKAHGGYVLPKNVPANQFLNLEGRKFSKSKGWVIEQHQYLKQFEAFANKEDALRYALIRTMPENKDGDFKWDEFVDLYDSELADNVGNFVNRVLTFSHKYFEGKSPNFNPQLSIIGDTEGESTTYHDFCTNVLSEKLAQLQKAIHNYEFKLAAKHAIDISRLGNAVLQNNAPWKVYKTNPDAPEIAAVIALGVQIAGILSTVLSPFVPFAAKHLRSLLNLPETQDGDFNQLLAAVQAAQPVLAVGHQIGEKAILFAKIKDRKDKSRLELIEQKKVELVELKKRLEAEAKKAAEANVPPIEFDDFQKVKLKIATIETAETVKKAKKLLKIGLKVGKKKHTVASGIAEHYKPEDIIGQQVIWVSNLKPKKIRGILSEGMILMTEDAAGKLVFVAPAENIADGVDVR